jgi:hypothetical protein
MIFLRIFLGIIWFIISVVYCILCSVHINKQFFRFVSIAFLGLSVLLSYFAFPVIIFFTFTLLQLLSYILWEHFETYITRHTFNPGRLIKHFCSWIFVKNEDALISFVFPKFLTYFVVLILSANRKFRSLVPGITNAISLGVDIDVESNDGIVSIHI